MDITKVTFYIGILLTAYAVLNYLGDFLPVDLEYWFKQLFVKTDEEVYMKVVEVESKPDYRFLALVLGTGMIGISKFILPKFL